MTAIIQDVFPALIVITTPEFPLSASELTFFPATTGEGAYQVNTARIVVTQDRVLIAKDSPTGPVTVYSQALAPNSHYKNPDRKGISYLTTASGQKIAFLKDTTCGCGSRLKTWRPYAHASSVKDPT